MRDEAVLDAMCHVARHEFVPEGHRRQAYDDRALPTSDGQTISQPYIVALMTEMAQIRSGHHVLEIGTGSGYQAAVLAYLGARVTTVELRPGLARSAERRLTVLGVSNVTVVPGDGTLGHVDAGPFDRIIVTAAAPHMPDALRHQLADPGRCVIPIGARDLQRLHVFELNGGEWSMQRRTACRFVPLTGEDGWRG